MSFRKPYFEELRAQSADLVTMINEAVDPQALYALCAVYQQLSHAEQDPPFDAHTLLQTHFDTLEAHILSTDIDALFYDFAELCFVLDYLDIEDEYAVSIGNLQKVIRGFPETFSPLSQKAQNILSLSTHHTRIFDSVLHSITESVHAASKQDVTLRKEERDAIFAEVDAEESNVIEINFQHPTLFRPAASGSTIEQHVLPSTQNSISIRQYHDEIFFTLAITDDHIDEPEVYCDGAEYSPVRKELHWEWPAKEGTWSISYMGTIYQIHCKQK